MKAVELRQAFMFWKCRRKFAARSGAVQQIIDAPGERKKPGGRGRIRTCDPCLKRALLYQLSYAPNSLPDLLAVYHSNAESGIRKVVAAEWTAAQF